MVIVVVCHGSFQLDANHAGLRSMPVNIMLFILLGITIGFNTIQTASSRDIVVSIIGK